MADKGFSGMFELFDVSVRRLRNGNKLRLVFESAEDIETEKELIEFRGQNVEAEITQEKEPTKKADIVLIRAVFEVFDMKCRRLRNGDKLQLVLEQMYSKDAELKAVKLRYEDCSIKCVAIEQELDFDEDE